MYKHKAFPGAAGLLRAEQAGHWLKAVGGSDASRSWCIKHNIGLVKAASEGIDSGGFVAPDAFDDAVKVVAETMGAFRARAEYRPATSDYQIRPRRVGNVTAAFVAEGAVIPESNPTLDAIGASMKKMGIMVRDSNELLEDSAVNTASFYAPAFGYADAALTDDWGFNGDGTQAFGGITGLFTALTGKRSSVAAASGHSTFLLLDGTDIVNLMNGVLASAMPGAAWFVSATGYAQTLCRLSATTGGLTASKRPDGTIDASYLGFPVVFSGKLPDVSSSLAAKPMMDSAFVHGQYAGRASAFGNRHVVAEIVGKRSDSDPRHTAT